MIASVVNLDFYFVLRINKSYAQNMNVIQLRPGLNGALFAERSGAKSGSGRRIKAPKNPSS